MDNNVGLARKLLMFCYNLLDEKDAVSFSDIVSAPEIKKYTRQEIVDTLNDMKKNGYIELLPNYQGAAQPAIIDVTYDGCVYMREKT